MKYNEDKEIRERSKAWDKEEKYANIMFFTLSLQNLTLGNEQLMNKKLVVNLLVMEEINEKRN